MFIYHLALKLGKTINELENDLGPTGLLKWQVFLNQEHWQNRIRTETDDGRSTAILSMLMGSNE